MNALRPAFGESFRYARLIGTGGIGSGIMFHLDGEHTLGRDESRLGELTGNQDYCKLHIICHYPAVLLNAEGRDEAVRGFELIPIGKVGADPEGESLVRQLRSAGMSVAHVDRLPDARTLFSVCFQYPDLAGGNITTSNSASGRVEPDDIDRAFAQLPRSGAAEIVLAAPEVPLAARIALLAEGRARGSFNVASVLASEVETFGHLGGYALTDLLAVNGEEARRIAGMAENFDLAEDPDLAADPRLAEEPDLAADPDLAGDAGGNRASEAAHGDGRRTALRCASFLVRRNPRAKLVMTDGAAGSYSYDDGALIHTPALRVQAVSTAGAGDALLGGLLCGLCCGLPFAKRRADPHFGATPLESAVELGTLLAAMAVTSPHSIHPEAGASTLADFAVNGHGLALSAAFRRMFALDQT